MTDIRMYCYYSWSSLLYLRYEIYNEKYVNNFILHLRFVHLLSLPHSGQTENRGMNEPAVVQKHGIGAVSGRQQTQRCYLPGLSLALPTCNMNNLVCSNVV